MDVAGEGQPVDDGSAVAGSMKVFVQPEELSSLAIATASVSSLSVRT
jgi:hypothetical protein